MAAGVETTIAKPPKLSHSQKILEAIDLLAADGIRGATPDQIIERAKRKHPSRLNIIFQPWWDNAFSKLEASGEIHGIRNSVYTQDSPSNRLYQRPLKEKTR